MFVSSFTFCLQAYSMSDCQEESQIYLNQWYEEYYGTDIYSCAECYMICEYRELPKVCECVWYTDKEGVDRCKECNVVYDGYCRKCNLCWYKDESGRLRCSSCDIEIVSIFNKPCECDHWYTDSEEIDRCKKCHAINDGSPCEMCKQ